MSDHYELTSKMNGFDLGVWNDLPEETREMILRAAGSFELEIDRAYDEGRADGKRDAEDVAAAAQHIALFRIGKAIDELDGPEFDDDESIIKARKHLKKAMGDLQ